MATLSEAGTTSPEAEPKVAGAEALPQPAAWPSLAVGASAFLVFAAGACPTIYVGDSGELVAAVYLLGIPHPSGYPLYVMLGKLWTLVVPFGSIAYRMSLFSAAAGGVTCGAVHRLCRRLGLHPVAALLAALLLAFAPSFWGEANIPRVYTLNAVFVAFSAAAAFEWHRSGRERALVLAFLFCGIGASNHTFMAIQAAALGAFAILTRPGLLRRPRPLLLGAAGFGLGLLPYAYLPVRSAANPALDWGNPESWDAFLKVVTRRDFWNRKWIEGPADLVPIGADYLASLGTELLWVGTALAVLGVVAGWRRRWPVLLPLLVMAGNVAAMAGHGSRSDIFIWHRYYIPSYLMAAVLAAMGCHALLERLPARARLLPLALPLLGLLLGWRVWDRSRFTIADDFSRTLLQTLPPGAHLSASDDNILFVLIYLHFVEGLRPDVDLILQGVGDANLPPLRFNPDTDPLFLTHHPNWSIKGLDVVPVGLYFQTVRSGTAPPAPRVPKWELDGALDPRVPKEYLTRNLVGHFHYMLGCSFEERDWPTAWREFKIAQRVASENDVLFYNLGLIFRRAGLIPEALAAFERSERINPRAIASTQKARASEKIKELRSEVAALTRIEQSLPPAPSAPGTAAYHRALAEQLEAKGLRLLARGHALRAMVLESGQEL